ncbi:hypothetical protein IFR05_004449 [Cadophora sp. M221]|nr:hypothetical protein IFR05_004449 [Cadophora sp. M221]
MDVVDLTGWASAVIKAIEISQGFGTGYKVEVREFILVEGDLRHEVWSHNGMRKYHKTPDWATADMAKMSEIMKKSAEEDIGNRTFNLAMNPADIKELASTAELNGEQVKFVKETAIMVNETAEISTVREATAFSHD